MQQEFKKSVEGFNSSNETFLVWQKDLEIFRKFRSESLKILKRGTGRTLIIEQNDKKKDKFWKNFQKCNWQMEENSFHF